MSRIDDLLVEHCPDGVPFRPLGQVVEIATARVDAASLDASNYVGVDNLLPDFGGRRDSDYVANSSGAIRFQPGDLLIGNIRPYLKKVWLADRTGGASPDVLTLSLSPSAREAVLPRFLYFLIASDLFIRYTMQHAKGAKMPRGDKAATLRYPVPVPPLEVQREIVRILNTFTELVQELEAELEARRRQYEHYRDLMLRASDAEEKTLGELMKYEQPGRYLVLSTAYRPEFDTPVLTAGQTFVLGYTDERDGIYPASPNAPVIIFDDFTTAFRWVDFPFKAKSSAMKILKARGGAVSLRFIWYAMHLIRYTPQDHARQWISTYAHFRVPVPPLEEQRRVVSILDKFDALASDLSIGLPAELAARRKQYEYYRDRLLKFEEAA